MCYLQQQQIIAIISIINIAPQLSAAAQDTVQDPSQLSAQITQAQEDIRKELIEQGQIISNDIRRQQNARQGLS